MERDADDDDEEDDEEEQDQPADGSGPAVWPCRVALPKCGRRGTPVSR